MNVLLVGGGGYVGGALTDILAASVHNIRVYDALLYEDNFRKPVDFVYGDARDLTRLKPQLEWADAVVWLAAIVGDGACEIRPEITASINVDAVRGLVDNFDGRIVFLSTCSVYGAQDKILDERSPTNPLSLYARTKLESESILADSNAIIFRLGTLYGIGDLFSRVRFDLVVNTLTVRAFMHGKINVFGGDQYRPLLHVRSAAEAIRDALHLEQSGIYNLKEQNYRISDLAEMVKQHFPDIEINYTELPFEDTRNYRVSSDLASDDLGIISPDRLNHGIQEIKELIENNRIVDLDDPRVSNAGFLSRNLDHPVFTNGSVIEGKEMFETRNN